MTNPTEKPLVIQELTAFYTGPLRDALKASGITYGFGDADTGADFDDMAYDKSSHTALVEVVGDGTTETGRVIGYGRGAKIVFEAVSNFTDQFGAPATFIAELSDQPEPPVYSNGGYRIAR